MKKLSRFLCRLPTMHLCQQSALRHAEGFMKSVVTLIILCAVVSCGLEGPKRYGSTVQSVDSADDKPKYDWGDDPTPTPIATPTSYQYLRLGGCFEILGKLCANTGLSSCSFNASKACIESQLGSQCKNEGVWECKGIL